MVPSPSPPKNPSLDAGRACMLHWREIAPRLLNSVKELLLHGRELAAAYVGIAAFEGSLVTSYQNKMGSFTIKWGHSPKACQVRAGGGGTRPGGIEPPGSLTRRRRATKLC
mmetsp:Transcript_11236/g.31285  ORF Transcript_11236/g.31285 Transcript_11236/m.31285 type:complete len:111 (-) Transcript_11236:49-381(-)